MAEEYRLDDPSESALDLDVLVVLILGGNEAILVDEGVCEHPRLDVVLENVGQEGLVDVMVTGQLLQGQHALHSQLLVDLDGHLRQVVLGDQPVFDLQYAAVLLQKLIQEVVQSVVLEMHVELVRNLAYRQSLMAVHQGSDHRH